MSNHTGGPTLNVSYNNLLKDWAAQGCASDPQCEECGKDTTDKQMHDIGIMWVCKDCNIMITQEDWHSDG
jgi:ribosomal protein L37AE/L43A